MIRAAAILLVGSFLLAGDCLRLSLGAAARRTAAEVDKEIADATDDIEFDPTATAYHRRGELYFQKQDLNKALADYSAAIHLDPKYVDAYIDRSQAYGFKGDWDRAMADAEHSVRLAPKNAMTHNHVGIAYDGYARAMSDADEKTAASLFDRAAASFDGLPGQFLDPKMNLPADAPSQKFTEAARKLDHRQKVQLLFDFSAAAFKAAIDIRPDYDFGNNNLGVYYARRGGPEDLKLSEKYFRAALKKSPRYADAYNNLGIVLARQGNLDAAIEAHIEGLQLRYDRAFDHNNLSRGAYMGRADQKAKNNEPDKARQDLDSALKESDISLGCDPNLLAAWQTKMEIIFRQNEPARFEKARDCVLKMAAIDAGSQQTIHAEELYVAGYCVPDHRLDDAITLLNEALKINDKVPQVYRLRAGVYAKKNDWASALADARKLRELAPDTPGVNELLHGIEAKMKEPHK